MAKYERNEQPQPTAQNTPVPVQRPRRLRRTPGIRRLARETRVSPDRITSALFTVIGDTPCTATTSTPGMVVFM